jgi:hypothetical protein
VHLSLVVKSLQNKETIQGNLPFEEVPCFTKINNLRMQRSDETIIKNIFKKCWNELETDLNFAFFSTLYQLAHPISRKRVGMPSILKHSQLVALGYLHDLRAPRPSST